MGREQIEALIRVLQAQIAAGPENVILGTWTIGFDRTRDAFFFDKCEFGGYCEERPAVIGASGVVLDRGGPLLEDSP